VAHVTRRFEDLDPVRVRAKLELVRERIAAAGRDPGEVELLAAIKYVPLDELPKLAEAGVELVGENRAQELTAKHAAHGELFGGWDFIGALQSRKLREIVPVARLVHSVATESTLAQLERHPAREVLIQVNVAGDQGKAGVAPAQLADFVDACPAPVGGLMTMPPFVERAEDNRRHFARLAELAAEHGLARLSMGTSQDYEVAVQEGATIVRLGSLLYS
jgi:PLP dependent protein